MKKEDLLKKLTELSYIVDNIDEEIDNINYLIDNCKEDIDDINKSKELRDSIYLENNKKSKLHVLSLLMFIFTTSLVCIIPSQLIKVLLLPFTTFFGISTTYLYRDIKSNSKKIIELDNNFDKNKLDYLNNNVKVLLSQVNELNKIKNIYNEDYNNSKFMLEFNYNGNYDEKNKVFIKK